jgi:hypothetical protein
VYAGTYVPGAAERVQHVYAWVLQLLRQRYKEGEQLMPPPIVGNAYRMLSEGLFSFEHARLALPPPHVCLSPLTDPRCGCISGMAAAERF